jgi:hypothetical protein
MHSTHCHKNLNGSLSPAHQSARCGTRVSAPLKHSFVCWPRLLLVPPFVCLVQPSRHDTSKRLHVCHRRVSLHCWTDHPTWVEFYRVSLPVLLHTRLPWFTVCWCGWGGRRLRTTAAAAVAAAAVALQLLPSSHVCSADLQHSSHKPDN